MQTSEYINRRGEVVTVIHHNLGPISMTHLPKGNTFSFFDTGNCVQVEFERRILCFLNSKGISRFLHYLEDDSIEKAARLAKEFCDRI